MSVVREQIAAQIRKDHPTFNTHDYPAAAPDNFPKGKPVQVSVFRSELTNGPTTLRHDVTIELMTGKADEGYLDGVLDDVLESVQRLPGITWTTATRTKFDDKYNGYRILLSAQSANIYRQKILAEGA